MNRGLLATTEDLRNLRGRVGRRPYDLMFDLLQKRCALILESRPVTETDWQTQHAQGVEAAALNAARACQGRVFDLLITHHIDPNSAYRDRAIEEVRLLAGWTQWLDPSHQREDRADLCTAECCATMAVALDWLAEDLSEPDRARCRRALLTKGLGPYREAVERKEWWYTCYHNWNAVINSGCGLGAVALADENAEAAEAVRWAKDGLEHFFAALGREGGWDEGISYWGYAMRYLLLFGLALDRTANDRFVFHQRGMETTGQFGIYFSPRGHNMSFGDSTAVPLYGTLYEIADRYANREVCWWLDRWAFHRDVETTGWSDLGLGLLLRPTTMAAAPAPKLQPLRVFNEIGWAAVADRWPEPSLYVSLKTGDLSAHHSHLDMNTVQIQVDGETLVSDVNNPPSPAAHQATTAPETLYDMQAQAHNTLMVDERDHRIDAQGRILEAEMNDAYRWVAAAAGEALGPSVRFNRHVIMLLDERSGDGHTVVVLDELTNAVAEKILGYWHTFAALSLNGTSGAVVGRRTGLHFRVVANEDVQVAVGRHELGKLTESVLTVTAPPVRHLVMATAFSRVPVDLLKVNRTGRGEVTLVVNAATLYFRTSRRHLKLASVAAPAVAD
ncbi:MAG: heparinase II/III domain-containing protein [Planctomycetota bacterium]